MRNAMTTEELARKLLRDVRRMSEEEKAKLRQQLEKEFGRPGTKRGDKIRLQ